MYEPYYRFSAKPFQLSPDPRFFYESRVHKRAYAYLEYGLFQGEGFFVITGEVGAGKTTIVRNLLSHLNPSQVVAAHLVSTQLDADDLLRSVATAFGLTVKGTDKASLLAELEKFLRQTAGDKKRALLIVDEAQNLTARAVEELRMLSNFQSGDRALLQSFLVGQPELRNILRAPDMQQFRQRIIASYHLGPLDRAETEAYIQHRLKQVGWVGNPQLEPDVYNAIFAFTAGIPRRINLVANRLLLAGYLNEKQLLRGSDVEEVVKEISEELGGNLSRSVQNDTAPESAPASEMQQGAALSAEAANAIAADVLPRIQRLEKAVGRILGLLQNATRNAELV